MLFTTQKNSEQLEAEAAKAALSKITFSPFEKTQKNAAKLAIQAKSHWCVIRTKQVKNMLTELTWHKKVSKQHDQLFAAKENQVEVVGRMINNFLEHLRVFGFQKVREVYNQYDGPRIRDNVKRKLIGNVFHTHFGTHPEYVIEYQVDFANRRILVTQLAPHRNFAYTDKLEDFKDYEGEEKKYKEKIQQVKEAIAEKEKKRAKKAGGHHALPLSFKK